MSRRAVPSGGASRKHPWWQWVIGGFVLFVVLAAIFGNDDKRAGVATTSTSLTRQARAGYRAAKAHAAERALARRAAADERRLADAQRRRDERAATQARSGTAGNCDPNYSGCVPPYPPDVNCPQVAGPVQVLGSDPHRLDGDGVACE